MLSSPLLGPELLGCHGDWRFRERTRNCDLNHSTVIPSINDYEDLECSTPAFCPAHPKIKLHADPHVYSREENLHGKAQRLRVVTIISPDQFLARASVFGLSLGAHLVQLHPLITSI